MKYYEQRRHLISKMVLLAVISVALFFALCDCAPKTTQQHITITYEKE